MREYRGALLLLAVAAVYLGSIFFFRARPEDIAARQETSRKENEYVSNIKKRANEKQKRAEQVKPKIEEAIEALEGEGVTREDLEAYFYDDIEEQVCSVRGCEN